MISAFQIVFGAMLILVESVATAGAQSNRWLTVESGDTYEISIDTTSIERRPREKLFKIWVRTVYTHDHPINAQDSRMMRSEVLRVEVDCGLRALRTWEGADYNADGDVLQRYDPKSQPLVKPLPETQGESIVNFVCDTVASGS